MVMFTPISLAYRKRFANTVGSSMVCLKYAMTVVGGLVMPLEAQIIAAMSKILQVKQLRMSQQSQYAAVEALSGEQDTVESMRVRPLRNVLIPSIPSLQRSGFDLGSNQGAFYLSSNVNKAPWR